MLKLVIVGKKGKTKSIIADDWEDLEKKIPSTLKKKKRTKNESESK